MNKLSCKSSPCKKNLSPTRHSLSLQEGRDFMAREKTQIKKIDNTAARQVTFSKRRRGLFKKAQELGVLCDADVAVIIFSSTGKKFEYSSSSMKEILDKYSVHTRNTMKIEQPSLELQLVDADHAKLSKEVVEKTNQLRRMMGEDLEGLSLRELQQLEKFLETGLSSVIQTKGDRIMTEITTLQQKSDRLIEENQLLKQNMAVMIKGKSVANAAMDHQTSDNLVSELGHQSSESITNNAPPGDDDSSDTCLRLSFY